MKVIKPRKDILCLLFLLTSLTRTVTAQGTLDPSKVELVHDRKAVDLVKGRPVEVEGRVNIVFVRGQSYMTLRDDALPILVMRPTISAPNKLRTELLSLHPEKSKIYLVGSSLDILQAEGYTIVCKLRLSASKDLKPETYEVKLTLPSISEAARRLKVDRPLEPPSFTFKVRVFANEPVLQETQAREKAETKKELEEELKELRKNQKKESMSTGAWIVIGLMILFLVIIPGISWLNREKGEQKADRCPRCRAYLKYTEEKKAEGPKNIGVFSGKVHYDISYYLRTCKKCGHKWRVEKSYYEY